jgi:CRISPR-associated protein Cas2
MRNVVFVSYDIADDRRLRLIYRLMRGRGDHVQYSVFRCELSPRERAELVAEIDAIIDHFDDQVLLIDTGPVEGRGGDCVQALGKPFVTIVRRAVIV